MQNHPPNPPNNDQNPQNYDSSYIQDQLSMQLQLQQTKGIHVLNIMSEAAARLGKHFGSVFIGWLIYVLSLTAFLIIAGYFIKLILVLAYGGVSLSLMTSGITIGLIVKTIFVFIFIICLALTAQMIFYFGFLSYISDLIELDSANYGNIYTGFQKIFQIFGFVILAVFPVVAFAFILALPFGFFSGFSKFTSPNPGMQQNSSLADENTEFTQVQYNPAPNQPVPNNQGVNPYSSPAKPASQASVVVYSLILLLAVLLYYSKLLLIPNLLIAQDMTLKEAIVESWQKVRGNTFLHIFLLLLTLGIISYCINYVSSRYIAPAMINPVSQWSFIKYALVNNLIFQVFFVFFIGCIAHTYNKLYPIEIRTDAFAHATDYSRKTHPKYFQPFQAQGQNQSADHTKIAQGYNAPKEDPFASPYQSNNEQDDESENILPKDAPMPRQQLEIREAAKRYKSGIKEVNNPEKQTRQKIQYVSDENKQQIRKPASNIEPPMPQSDEEFDQPMQKQGHISNFGESLFADEDYPAGKIVPVDAMRMMRDKKVRFIEVMFQDVNHAYATMKKIRVFSKNPDTKEYAIRDPLSFSLSVPKLPSNPVKLFFGGTDMTIKELWNAKEVIIENMGKIVKMNRGDE